MAKENVWFTGEWNAITKPLTVKAHQAAVLDLRSFRGVQYRDANNLEFCVWGVYTFLDKLYTTQDWVFRSFGQGSMPNSANSPKIRAQVNYSRQLEINSKSGRISLNCQFNTDKDTFIAFCQQCQHSYLMFFTNSLLHCVLLTDVSKYYLLSTI